MREVCATRCNYWLPLANLEFGKGRRSSYNAPTLFPNTQIRTLTCRDRSTLKSRYPLIHGQVFCILNVQSPFRGHPTCATWIHTEQLYRFEPWEHSALPIIGMRVKSVDDPSNEICFVNKHSISKIIYILFIAYELIYYLKKE